jgi:hypothetical protein
VSDTDRVHIAFTSSVPEDTRRTIIDTVVSLAQAAGMYVYQEPSTELSGTIRLDITAHDRATFDLTDGQVVERLRLKAAAQGISINEMLRRLAAE